MKRENFNQAQTICKAMTYGENRLDLLERGFNLCVSVENNGGIPVTGPTVDVIKTLVIADLKKQLSELSTELEAL